MSGKTITILGIESSCDETSAAINVNGKTLANITATQKVHEQYGGVVPELASRAHQKNIVPVVSAAFKKAGISPLDLNAIAYTLGPGLMGSLLVGSSFAKGLSVALDVPLIEVNHMQSHVHALFVDQLHEGGHRPEFPFLCLTVSGGHTQIIKVNDFFDFELLGETIDDAAGEAFDKISRIMDLPYPGGPVMDRLAREGQRDKFKFPFPKAEGFNFSFSGLKTSVLYFLKEKLAEDPLFIEKNKTDLCASIQHTIIRILMQKLEAASDATGIKDVGIAGGVSANSELRAAILRNEELKGWRTFIPPFEFCTDNAGMIAMTGYLKYQQKEFSDITAAPKARYPVADE